MLNVMESIGANTFQYFSRNPRGSKQKELNIDDVNRFNEKRNELGVREVLCHAPYTLNPC